MRNRHLYPVSWQVAAWVAQMSLAFLLVAAFTATASRAGDHGGGHYPVTICHNGRTIVVDDDAIPGHLRHGDTLGECTDPEPTPTATPTPTPTQEVTPWPTPTVTTTPTSSPSASPSPEPTSTATVAPTPTATPSPPSSPSPAAPAVTSAPSPGGTASSSSTSTPTTPPDDTWVGHVGTVDTLAATGSTPSEGVALAAFVVAWGIVMLAIANRNRRRPR